MKPEYILTLNYQVNFWSKEKNKFVEKFMANQSLLDHFAFH